MNNCNICKDTNYKILHQDDYTYAICKNCGHVFQSDRREASHYHELPYESQWNDYMNHSKNRATYVADFIGDLNSVSKVIDIGCGPGGTLYHLKQQFPKLNIYGITAPCDKEKMIKGVKVQYGDFENDTFKGQYDLAIMCHVMEHFLDPINSLLKVNKMLNKDGLVYIEVPSFHFAEIRSNPQFCPVHLSYFSKEKMIQILQFCGFEIVKVHESKYWGNLKIVARKSTNTFENSLKENWIKKLIKWEINKKVVNKITRIIKKYKKIGSNE